MEPLIIQATEDTPEIVFDPNQNIFKISKISVPEDAYEFYYPIIQWIRDYSSSPLTETLLEFDLEYVNSASANRITSYNVCYTKLLRKN